MHLDTNNVNWLAYLVHCILELSKSVFHCQLMMFELPDQTRDKTAAFDVMLEFEGGPIGMLPDLCTGPFHGIPLKHESSFKMASLAPLNRL
jgi:hypothetical protein